MIDISELPRDPEDAFRRALESAQELSIGFPSSNLSPHLRIKVVAYLRTLQTISRHLSNSLDYQDPLERAVNTANHSNPSGTYKILASISELYIANTLHDHFINTEDEHDFNELEWQGNDRDLVLGYLADSRKIISNSPDFDDHHTRRMLYWLSKAENEAFKMKGKFATFIAATSEILTLADEAGDKGTKLAAIVQMVRTTTRRNVSVSQIETDEKPKQIAPPKTEDPA